MFDVFHLSPEEAKHSLVAVYDVSGDADEPRQPTQRFFWEKSGAAKLGFSLLQLALSFSLERLVA